MSEWNFGKMGKYYDIERDIVEKSNWSTNCLSRLSNIFYKLGCCGRNYEQIRDFHIELNKRICEMNEDELAVILRKIDWSLPETEFRFDLPMDSSLAIDSILGVDNEKIKIERYKQIYKYKSPHWDPKAEEIAGDSSNR